LSELSTVFYKTVKHHSTCLICGTAKDIQFHHVCPSDKIAEVSKVAKANELRATIEEMNKCVPLCDVHHKAVHRGLRHGWLSGQFDNGQASYPDQAARFMPYLPWFFHKNPTVLINFYRNMVDRDVQATRQLMIEAGIVSNLVMGRG
jgi:hypothetical protein